MLEINHNWQLFFSTSFAAVFEVQRVKRIKDRSHLDSTQEFRCLVNPDAIHLLSWIYQDTCIVGIANYYLCMKSINQVTNGCYSLV